MKYTAEEILTAPTFTDIHRLKHVGAIARIDYNEAMSLSDIGRLLTMVQAMGEVDDANVPPTYNTNPIVNNWREDIANEPIQDRASYFAGMHVSVDMDYRFKVPLVIDDTEEPSAMDRAITILIHRELGWKPTVKYEITPEVDEWIRLLT